MLATKGHLNERNRPFNPKSIRAMMPPEERNTGALRKIAAALAEAGHLNERGQPFNPKSIVAMVAQKT